MTARPTLFPAKGYSVVPCLLFNVNHAVDARSATESPRGYAVVNRFILYLFLVDFAVSRGALPLLLLGVVVVVVVGKDVVIEDAMSIWFFTGRGMGLWPLTLDD